MSGIKHVVVTCRRGTSVVRNLKFFTVPHSQLIKLINQYHCTYLSSNYW